LVTFETGEVELGMAGVPHAFHVSAGGNIERIALSGTPLGYLRKIAPVTAVRALEPGDRLVLVTDGLLEQVNATGHEWSYAGVESALAALCSESTPPEQIAEGVLRGCEEHGGGGPRLDDRTVVVLARGAA
jgi:serine phosphatase RsbU (regulator of sigma subunit)